MERQQDLSDKIGEDLRIHVVSDFYCLQNQL